MRILLSGGGTAGHINPALAIANYAKSVDKECEVLFVGTKKGLEKTLVPKENFDIVFVNVEGLKREISLKSAVSAAKLGAAVVKSLAIMKKFKPDIVIGTGGYVCVSSVIAAKILGIPTIVHEQNVFPGSAVKFLADKCDVTAISFVESKKYLKNALDVRLTGNPIRPDILSHTKQECRKRIGAKGKVILAFGGSLGAMRINDVMAEFIERNKDMKDTLYFATGKRDYARVKSLIKDVPENFHILEYIDNMDILMNAADVVICRSGAITLAEISALGKSAILIPSPNVTNNHQEYNARALSDRGAAITITEDKFDVHSLEKALFKIINDESYALDMQEKSREMGITDACDKIYEIMQNLTQ